MLEKFQALISEAALRYAVPEVWIKAVIMTESSGQATAYRAEPKINDASYGLMQLLLQTARGLGYVGTPEGLYDPGVNIDLGTKLLAKLRQVSGDDFQAVYSAYNSGKPDRYLTSPAVATNVKRAVDWLRHFIEEEPFVATSGAGALLVAVLLWYYAKKKK